MFFNIATHNNGFIQLLVTFYYFFVLAFDLAEVLAFFSLSLDWGLLNSDIIFSASLLETFLVDSLILDLISVIILS